MQASPVLGRDKSPVHLFCRSFYRANVGINMLNSKET